MQFGFRKHHSTETAVCLFLEKIKKDIDKGGVVGALFLDLKKAFDTVNHQVLIHKLSLFNFSLHTLNWINSYLDQRRQYVRIQNSISTTCENQLGLPQGSALAPILFSLYINDLPGSFPFNVQCQMYADDAVIYVHAKNKDQAAQELSSAMNNVSDWLHKSQLILNVSKTVCMYFTKKTGIDTVDPDMMIHGTKIKTVQTFKYLGIIVDSKLNFKQHVKKVANTMKFNLSNFKFIRDNLTLESAKLYFNAMIVSHMTYCMTTWTLACKTTLKSIETIYKQALKTLDKKPKTHHHCRILEKHDILSWENMIRYADSPCI